MTQGRGTGSSPARAEGFPLEGQRDSRLIAHTREVPLEGRFSFDSFQLDLSTGRLSGHSGPIPLTPKALAVLEYLAARPGRLVGKDEL